MENKRYQGKTLDGAISEACADLGIPSDKLRYKVVQEGSDGLFGLGLIGVKKYVIEITDGRQDKADNKPKKRPQDGAESHQDNKQKPQAQPVQKKVQSQERIQNQPQNRNQKNAAGEAPQNTKPSDEKSGSDRQDKAQNAQPAKNRNQSAEAEAVDNLAEEQKNGEKKPSDNRSGSDRYKDRPRRSDRYNRGDERGNGTQQRRPERRSFEDRAKGGYGRDAAAVKSENPNPAPKRYEKTGTVTGDPVKTAEEFLTSLFKSMEMNISYKGVFKDENNELVVDLSGEDMGVLIGKRGQTLDALQYLTGQVVNKHQTAYIRVKIDTENYRERRKETMEALAQNIADKVKKTHKPVALEPMNPYERRIIHSYLQNEKDIITKSEGVEPYRHVIVCPVKKKRNLNDRRETEIIARSDNEAAADKTAEAVNAENTSETDNSAAVVLNQPAQQMTQHQTQTEIKLTETVVEQTTVEISDNKLSQSSVETVTESVELADK